MLETGIPAFSVLHNLELKEILLPMLSMNASRQSDAFWWISLFFVERFEATVCVVKLMTPPIESQIIGVMSNITCNAYTFTLALESFTHGMNLSKIWNGNSTNVSYQCLIRFNDTFAWLTVYISYCLKLLTSFPE